MNVACFPEKNGLWMQSDRAEEVARPFPWLRTRAGPASSAACQRPRNLTRPWGSQGSRTASPVRQALRVACRVGFSQQPYRGTLFEQLHLTDMQTEVCRKREADESVLAGSELESGEETEAECSWQKAGTLSWAVSAALLAVYPCP